MQKNWFIKRGWGYVPKSPAGWVITLLAAAFCVQVFLAVDRKSHSASDTLYGVFPYVISMLTVWGWAASNTSEKK